MKIAVGTYEFSVANQNTAWFTERRMEVRGQYGKRTHYNVQWFITATFVRSTQAALTAAIDEMKAAIKTPGDAIVYDNDDVETTHSIRVSDTKNGIRLVAVNFPNGRAGAWGGRTEYVNLRTVQVVLQADVIDYESTLVSYFQMIRSIGTGGPHFVIQESLGDAIRQNLSDSTRMVVIQSGHAEGLLDYPLFPNSLFPASLKNRDVEATYLTPREWGGVQNTTYPIRWVYPHEGANGFLITPPPEFI